MDYWIWLDWTATDMLAFGAPALGLALFLGALGLPMPGTILVLASGALVQQGMLDGPQALAIALAGVVLGDSLSYGLGRLAGTRVIARLAHTRTWQEAHMAFSRQGGGLIYLTRFLLTPLAIPVNLIAGSSGYPFRRFLRNDLAGELTWLMLYGSTGYAAGTQWEVLGSLVTTAGQYLLQAAVLAIGLALLARVLLQRRATNHTIRWA